MDVLDRLNEIPACMICLRPAPVTDLCRDCARVVGGTSAAAYDELDGRTLRLLRTAS